MGRDSVGTSNAGLLIGVGVGVGAKVGFAIVVFWIIFAKKRSKSAQGLPNFGLVWRQVHSYRNDTVVRRSGTGPEM